MSNNSTIPSGKVYRIERDTFPDRPTKDFGPKPTKANFHHLLIHYKVQVRYDEVKKQVIFDIPGFSATIDNNDEAAFQHITNLCVVNNMRTSNLRGLILGEADSKSFNPVADWILSKPWDGEDRLEEFMNTLQCRKTFPDALKRTLMRRWLISAAAAVLIGKGFMARGVLTLQGEQGMGKTSWGANLMPKHLSQQYIKVDHHLDPANKDSVMTAVSHWIVEIGELESSFKKDVARLKGFLTAGMDKFRRPYAAMDSAYSRRTIFFATVNKSDFLIDNTGNSRWWTLPIESINYNHNIDTQQLFAQVAILYEKGEQWWLTSEEEDLLNEQNANFMATSYIRDRLINKLNMDKIHDQKLPAMSASQVLHEVLDIKNPTNPQARECGAVLRELLGEPRRIGGYSKWRIPLTNPNKLEYQNSHAKEENFYDLDEEELY